MALGSLATVNLLCASAWGNQCSDLQAIAKIRKSALSQAYAPQILGPASSLDEAKKLAQSFNVQFDPSFLKLPEADQLKNLNTVNSAISHLPPIVLRILKLTDYRILVLEDSLATVSDLAFLKTEEPEILQRPALTMPETKTTYISVDPSNDVLKKNGLQRAVLHELGHAFDNSIARLKAGNADEDNEDHDSLTNPDFESAHQAALPLIKGTGIETTKEYFADMFFYYFDSPERRKSQQDKLPETYRFFNNWFGDQCAKP